MEKQKWDIENVGLTGKNIDKIPDTDKQIVKIAMLWVRHGYNKALNEVLSLIPTDSTVTDEQVEIGTYCLDKQKELQTIKTDELLKVFNEISDSLNKNQ